MQGLDNNIIEKILEKGKIYEVGGGVRDKSISPILPDVDKDYLVTGIPLEELCQILSKFGKVDLVGKSFGIIKFVPRKKKEETIQTYDIALPRKEYSTGVGHKDFEVDFDENLRVEDDLARRDFTINAMALELPNEKLIDPLNGRKDIKNRLVRFTSPQSFKDDPLRMLRGIGFAARFEFEIEKKTYDSLCENVSLISTVSMERIQEEINKLLLRAKRPSTGFRLMQKSGMLEILFSELEKTVGIDQPGGYHAYDVFEHSILSVDYAPVDLTIRLASLFHDISKPETKFLKENGSKFYGHDKKGAKVAEDILKRLKYSNEIISTVKLLIDKHMFTTGVTDKGVRRLVNRVGKENIFKLLDLRRADVEAQGKGGETRDVDELEQRIRLEMDKKSPFGLKDLEIDGNDVMEKFNLTPGPKVGKTLKYLLEKVLDEPELNHKDILLKEAKSFLKTIQKE
ncbi:MAG TPA: HDIG domain-containing protein [candidate division Zixibacteria bacterium]